MRTLPQHIPQRPIQLPLNFFGMDWCELAGWHQFFRKQNDTGRCLEIEREVEKLSQSDMVWIGKLHFYQPIFKKLA